MKNSTQRHCAVGQFNSYGVAHLLEHNQTHIYCFQRTGPDPERSFAWSSEQIFAHFSEESHRVIPC